MKDHHPFWAPSFGLFLFGGGVNLSGLFPCGWVVEPLVKDQWPWWETSPLRTPIKNKKNTFWFIKGVIYYLALNIRNTSTTKTWVAYGNSPGMLRASGMLHYIYIYIYMYVYYYIYLHVVKPLTKDQPPWWETTLLRTLYFYIFFKPFWFIFPCSWTSSQSLPIVWDLWHVIFSGVSKRRCHCVVKLKPYLFI